MLSGVSPTESGLARPEPHLTNGEEELQLVATMIDHLR